MGLEKKVFILKSRPGNYETLKCLRRTLHVCRWQEGSSFVVSISMWYISSWIETSHDIKTLSIIGSGFPLTKKPLHETQPNLGHREHATWGLCSAKRPTSASKTPGSCQNLQGEFCLLCEMSSRFQGSFRNTVTLLSGQIQCLT